MLLKKLPVRRIQKDLLKLHVDYLSRRSLGVVVSWQEYPVDSSVLQGFVLRPGY